MKSTIPLFLTALLVGCCAPHRARVPLWQTLPEAPPLPRADESGLAPVNGVQLYYARFNRGGAAPVILLHGGLGSSDEWGFEVPRLAATHQVVVVDTRGHGRSTLSGQPLSYALLASDVLGLMDYLNIRKASVVGWSDGGVTGLLLAIKHPERIDKLFTFGTNYNRSGYKTAPPDSVAAARFMSRAQAKYRKLPPTPDNFAGLKNALGKMYGAEPNLDPADLRTIQAPTVIACGEHEQFITPDHFQQLAWLIPGAHLVTLARVSHGGPLQDPVRFHRAVVHLLDGR